MVCMIVDLITILTLKWSLLWLNMAGHITTRGGLDLNRRQYVVRYSYTLIA